MTKFEQVGINKQLSSESKRDALRNFQISCKICCYRGIKINCDQCGIAVSHDSVISAFEVLDKSKHI